MIAGPPGGGMMSASTGATILASLVGRSVTVAHPASTAASAAARMSCCKQANGI